jgi:hypothetical protein
MQLKLKLQVSKYNSCAIYLRVKRVRKLIWIQSPFYFDLNSILVIILSRKGGTSDGFLTLAISKYNCEYNGSTSNSITLPAITSTVSPSGMNFRQTLLELHTAVLHNYGLMDFYRLPASQSPRTNWCLGHQ